MLKLSFNFLLRQTTTTTTNKRDKEQKSETLGKGSEGKKNQTVREKLIENLKVGVQIVISFQYII